MISDNVYASLLWDASLFRICGIKWLFCFVQRQAQRVLVVVTVLDPLSERDSRHVPQSNHSFDHRSWYESNKCCLCKTAQICKISFCDECVFLPLLHVCPSPFHGCYVSAWLIWISGGNHKSFCLVSIWVRYDVVTKIWDANSSNFHDLHIFVVKSIVAIYKHSLPFLLGERNNSPFICVKDLSICSSSRNFRIWAKFQNSGQIS